MKALLSLIAALALFSPLAHAQTIVEITANIDSNDGGGSFTFRLNPADTTLSITSPGNNEWDFDNAGTFVSEFSGDYVTGSYTPAYVGALQTTGSGSNAYLFLALSFDTLSYQGHPFDAIEIDFYGNIPFTYNASLTPTEYLASFAGTHYGNDSSAVFIYFTTGSGEPGGVPLESITITVIPEPGAMILTGLSGGLLLAYGARRRGLS